MFGYVKVYPPELRLREYECYRGIYCGLCRAMGKCTGCVSRCFLSYDMLFLVLVRMILNNEKTKIKLSRCFVHPFKKRSVADVTPSMNYAAQIGAILGEYKIEDDISDKHGIHSLRAHALRPVFSVIKKKAVKSSDVSDVCLLIDRNLKDLSDIEESNSRSPDEAADCFGKLLAGVFSYNLSDGSAFRIAENIGMHVGRWIYLCDAIDDFKDDQKSGAYNPFSSTGLPDKDTAYTALMLELSQMDTALSLLKNDQKELYELVFNTVKFGMPSITDSILNKVYN